MSRTVHSLKLVSHSASKLDTLTYDLGDVVFDETNKTIRVMDSETFGGHTLATREWVTASGISGLLSSSTLTTALQSYVTSTALTNVLNSYALSNTLQPVATSGIYSDLTGKPDLTVYATHTDLSTAINNLINGAPGALNTLNELSAALGNDENFATTISSAIGSKAPLASPTFTGTVTIPAGASISGYAPLASPTFTGTATAAILKVSSTELSLGDHAGFSGQGSVAIAFGSNAGRTNQGNYGVAIGASAGYDSQGASTVALGVNSGWSSQGQYAIAIGAGAGNNAQGSGAIAIGRLAGSESQVANSIIINASGSTLNNTNAGLYIDPVRSATATSNVLFYDTTSKEITYASLTSSTVGLGNVTNESKSTMFASPTFTGTVSTTGNKVVVGTTSTWDLTGFASGASVIEGSRYTIYDVGNGASMFLNNMSYNSGGYQFLSGNAGSGIVLQNGGIDFAVISASNWNYALNISNIGTLTTKQSTEVLNTKTSATGTVTHDFSTGAIWYHSSISANFTANFTNVPTTNDRTIVCTLILSQGATAYIPNAVQIAGSPQTIKWLGGSAPSGNANKVDIVSFTLIRTGSAWAAVTGSLSTYG